MSGSARQETMLRKPILMPPSMIDKVDKIARNRKVSFAEVVRETVNAFDGDLSLLNERVITLIGKVNRMDQDIRHMNERLIRLETLAEIARMQPVQLERPNIES